MRRFLLLLLLLMMSNLIMAQEDDIEEVGFTHPELIAAPEIGFDSLYKWFTHNMEWQQGQLTIAGKVWIEFLVDTTGNILQAKVVKGLTPETDAEALRLIQAMPEWIPAQNRGEKIKSKVILPLYFGDL